MSLQSRQKRFRNRWYPFLLVLMLGMLLGCEPTRAQTIGVTYSAAAQTEAARKSLSPAAQAVMERLSNLGTLPVGDVRYHAGDLPNGSAVNLDDSSWMTIQMPYIASADPVWLRKWIEVPKTFGGYDPTGAKIWLQQPTRGGLTVYCNGVRVARGEDMEPFILLNSAKPGERLLLAIRLEKTTEPKNLRHIELHIDFAPNRPNPEVLYSELLTAAILVPSLVPDGSSKPELEKAILAVDLKALDAGDQVAFDASLRNAQSALAPIGKIIGETTFHLTGNSHIDAAWLWPWTETVDVVKRTFGTAAQLMDEYPTYTYTQSATQYNVWIADKYPEINKRMPLQQKLWVDSGSGSRPSV